MAPARLGLLLGFAALSAPLIWALAQWPSTPWPAVAKPAVQSVWMLQVLLIALFSPPLAVQRPLGTVAASLLVGLAVPLPVVVVAWLTGGAEAGWLLAGELWTLGVSLLVLACAWVPRRLLPDWGRQMLPVQALGVALAITVWTWRHASGMPTL